MATGEPIGERKRPARIVKLVLSAIKTLGKDDGCPIGKILDYVADVGRQVAPKREVMAALKRGVEFGIMNKRRGRYFVKSVGDQYLTRTGRRVVRKNRRPPGKDAIGPSIGRKLATRKRRVKTTKPGGKLKRSARKRVVRRLRKSRFLPTQKTHYRLFDLYVNPSCRMSAKSSVASTQIIEQEETENCA